MSKKSPGKIMPFAFMQTRTVGEKLAASLAVAQSVRLDFFEEAVEAAVLDLRHLPEQLARVGLSARILRPRRFDEFRRHVAALQQQIIDVNIVQDLLDVPAVFWEDDRWQPFWKRVHKYLEVAERIDVLNSRYKCLQGFLGVVHSEREAAQSFRLTWIIVVLLCLQIVAIVYFDLTSMRH
eukprot:GHVT01028276.1.p2 GENE.GHVT01028276.1~~GHVT01028276.1.p2  ORF type:complete len:180 (+),score=46.88 GHVT01028276.1:96-635(+)